MTPPTEGPGSSQLWRFGLSAWIIQDGNYGDFSVGDEAEFAVEFVANELRPAAVTEPSATALADGRYHVSAIVRKIVDETAILDVGIDVYGPTEAGLVSGGGVAGRVYLGVDAFDYFERLAKDPRFPPLIYTWRIIAIDLDTTPWVLTGAVWQRDASRRSSAAVARTNAWEDDDGHGEYTLTCERLPGDPARRSATAAH